MGKKWKKVWQVGPLCLLWTMWEARNRIVFKDESFSSLREKTFVFLFWSETKLSIPEGSSTFIGFIDWMG